MPGSSATLRPARPDEADALTRLMVRAKASHGYDPATVRTFAPALILTAGHISRDWVTVACAAPGNPEPGDPEPGGGAPGGTLLGFAHVERRDDPAVAWLEDLFVDPAAQGQRVGTLLWEAVLGHARSLGATELRFDADPNAVGFYRRLGAAVVGTSASTLIPGRTMPHMRYLLE